MTKVRSKQKVKVKALGQKGHTAQEIVEFDPDWAFPDCSSILN